MRSERNFEAECHRTGETGAVVGIGDRRGKACDADAGREVGLHALPSAEGQRAADVQVLDVHVAGRVAVLDLGRLPRVPELVEAVVAPRVAHLERDREASAFVEVARLARVPVLEAAARPVAAVEADLEGGRRFRVRRAGGEQQRGGECDPCVHAPGTISYAPPPCHCERESFALKSAGFVRASQGFRHFRGGRRSRCLESGRIA